MARITVISPNYFPLAGIGAQRVKGLTIALANQGHSVKVFTLPESAYEAINMKFDHGDDHRISSSGIRVCRVALPKRNDSLDKLFKKFRLFRLLWFFGYNKYWDRFTGWDRVLKSHEDLSNALSESQVLITFAGPYAGIKASSFFKRKYSHLKWILDLRDPFSDHFGWLWPSWFHWKLLRAEERKAVRDLDKLVVVTEEMKVLYIKRGLISANRIDVITNGYEG